MPVEVDDFTGAERVAVDRLPERRETFPLVQVLARAAGGGSGIVR
jgi:hypothetical protein